MLDCLNTRLTSPRLTEYRSRRVIGQRRTSDRCRTNHRLTDLKVATFFRSDEDVRPGFDFLVRRGRQAGLQFYNNRPAEISSIGRPYPRAGIKSGPFGKILLIGNIAGIYF